jgi:hypothetical protein
VALYNFIPISKNQDNLELFNDLIKPNINKTKVERPYSATFNRFAVGIDEYEGVNALYIPNDKIREIEEILKKFNIIPNKSLINEISYIVLSMRLSSIYFETEDKVDSKMYKAIHSNDLKVGSLKKAIGVFDEIISNDSMINEISITYSNKIPEKEKFGRQKRVTLKSHVSRNLVEKIFKSNDSIKIIEHFRVIIDGKMFNRTSNKENAFYRSKSKYSFILFQYFKSIKRTDKNEFLSINKLCSLIGEILYLGNLIEESTYTDDTILSKHIKHVLEKNLNIKLGDIER